MKALGRQLIVEYYGCNDKLLDSIEKIEYSMLEAARKSGATIVEKVFHRFSPWGVSGVVVIAESHLAIHTWPEFGYAAVDLFTCGTEVDPMRGFEYLKVVLEAESFSVTEIKRGLLADPSGRAMFKPNAVPEEAVNA